VTSSIHASLSGAPPVVANLSPSGEQDSGAARTAAQIE
jgi:hypothetical protein